jgi:mono/diheme cytochrome c family protein
LQWQRLAHGTNFDLTSCDVRFYLNQKDLRSIALAGVVVTLGWGRAVAAESLVAQGEYVARAADCMSCHTLPGGKPFAGGDELKTVFGSIYGPNITPDRRTGIGTWSKADFTRALRRGIRKDGGLLYPAMPYVDYTKMTDDDLNALWAYFRTIPAVEHAVPPAEKTFKFPFNIRAGNAAWQALFFKPGRWKPAPDKAASWNRGRYLVTVLGHCGECHTPKDIAKAQKFRYHLTGGQLEGWYAPDISNDPLSAIAPFDVDQVARFLKTGVLPNNTTAFGPMQETIHDSLSHLTDGDLHAIALYLKQEPNPQSQPPPKTTISPESLAAGRTLYINNCSSCHQPNGRGLPGQVPALDGNTAVTASQPNDAVMAILQGFGPHGTWGAMGSFAHLSNQQIADLVNYIRTAWSNHAEPNAVEWSVGNWRAFADIPAKERQPDLICPLLPPAVSSPALAINPRLLRKAAWDAGALQQVVNRYTAARAQSPVADTVEALSSAYCRAVVSEKISLAQSAEKIATFTQEVAIALSERGHVASLQKRN